VSQQMRATRELPDALLRPRIRMRADCAVRGAWLCVCVWPTVKERALDSAPRRRVRRAPGLCVDGTGRQHPDRTVAVHG
jgi:hypothetical protein